MSNKKPIKWTEDLIQTEADKYNTRSSFKTGNRCAYQAAISRGILDDVCSHTVKPLPKRKWTEASIKEVANQYQTRNQFKKGNSKAYGTSRRLGILDKVCSHMGSVYIVWDYVTIKNEALKYDNRYAFEKGNKNAYQAARTREILDEVCSHMPKLITDWSEEKIRLVASKYLTRVDFERGNSKAYAAARRYDILSEVCAHMDYAEKASANDLFYVWKPKAHSNLYKIGISSQRLDEQRIEQVARNFNNEKDIILKLKVKDARSIETHILNAYPEYEFKESFDGSTEFRQLTESQLEYVKHYARCNAN